MKHSITYGVTLLALSVLLILTNGQQKITNASESVTYDGIIESRAIVNVGSSVSGVLDLITVERGDLVKKGQVLARLQSDVELATLKLARARSELKAEINAKKQELEYAIRNKERMESLYENKAVAFEKWDEIETRRIIAEHRLAVAQETSRLYELELQRSEAAFNRLTFKSPIDGVVVERFMTVGEYVEDRPIMKLAQLDPLNVEVILPVELYGTVKVGMNAIIIPEGTLGSELKAKVIIVDRFLDAASSTFGVRLELPNSDYRIPPGLHCKVRFSLLMGTL